MAQECLIAGCIDAPIEAFVGPLPVVTVSAAVEAELAALLPFGLGLFAGLYQAFTGSGVPPDEYPGGIPTYLAEPPHQLAPPPDVSIPVPDIIVDPNLSRVLPPEYTVFGDRFTKVVVNTVAENHGGNKRLLRARLRARL